MKQSTLGSCIRTLRMQNNLTQLQLAELLGVTDKAVSKWERDLSYPDIALFPKLADILGTTVDGLLRECKETCQPSKLLQAFEMSRDIRMPLHIIQGCVEIIGRLGALGSVPECPSLFRCNLNFVKVAQRVRIIAECCIPCQFRLQVSLFIMDIAQGEGGGSDAIED